jgi:hypothetical protein
MNLAYTPQKAISLKIAAEVARQTPRFANYGNYPAITLLDSKEDYDALEVFYIDGKKYQKE